MMKCLFFFANKPFFPELVKWDCAAFQEEKHDNRQPQRKKFGGVREGGDALRCSGVMGESALSVFEKQLAHFAWPKRIRSRKGTFGTGLCIL
jgi:hypothetical protein